MLKIAMYSDKGANARKLTQTLRGWGYEVKLVRGGDLQRLSPDLYDVLYLPGGWYQFEMPQKEAIQRFVAEGGGCVGTCAGSYHVGGLIPLIPGRVLLAGMRGRLYLEPQQGDHPILRDVAQPCTRHSGRRWEQVAVTQLGGPLIFPENPEHIVASYDFEGEIGAIVAAPLGAGRAVAIASHPELALAALPQADTPALRRQTADKLPQGDARLIVRNAVEWAAGKV